MALAPLYRRHSLGLAAIHSDLENHAAAQEEVLTGTPGSVIVRRNAAGSTFYVRQHYDALRRKRDRYLAGPAGSPEADAIADRWRARIAESNDVIRSAKMLLREGYHGLEPKPFAAIAPLVDHGLFRAGAVLVGSHAFGAIANKLGIRVSAFPTEDIDIARPQALKLAASAPGGFLGLLKASGIAFVAVPEFDPRTPSTKFKEAGRSRFQVDLLAPAAGREATIRAVPELDAHATALPHLGYLTAVTQPGIVISHHGVAAVRIPVPERFAVHKLVVSELRTGRSAKSAKDLRQAAILLAATAELFPGSVSEAWEALATTARRPARAALAKALPILAVHANALEELSPLA